jgi:hypothetical protein
VFVIVLAIVSFAAATQSACAPPAGSFACEADSECVLAGAQGICQPVGYCSFPDPDCNSGQRYGEYGPIGVGGRCVPTQDELDDAGVADAPPGSPDAHADATTLPSPPDAAMLPPDATVLPPDATPLPPDAAPLPDAGAPDQVATFGETPQAMFKNVTGDTWIDSMNPTQNHGADPVLRTDGDPLRHALLRFDVSALPATAVVQSARIELYTTATGGLTTGSVQAFRLKQGWVEGNKIGTDGTTNWTERSDSAGWSNAGAGPPGSRDSTALAEFVPSANDTLYLVPVPASVVQGWRANVATANGVIFVAKNATDLSALFVSREGAAAKRPVLRVVYKLP